MLRASLFVLFLLGTGIAAAFVMGEDDRKEAGGADLSEPGIGQTGLIRIAGEDYATGLLTGANCDVVISAGHVAVRERAGGDAEAESRKPGRIGPMTFHASPDPADRGIAMQLVATGYGTSGGDDQEARDWGVYRLASPADMDCAEITPAGEAADCGGDVMMPAYHFDRRDVLLIERNCSAYAGADGLLLVHDCDSKEGSSGAPLYCVERSGPRLIGINVSGLTHRDYYDPGIYGERGESFHPQWHKNYAVAIEGGFRAALREELENSRRRKHDARD